MPAEDAERRDRLQHGITRVRMFQLKTKGGTFFLRLNFTVEYAKKTALVSRSFTIFFVEIIFVQYRFNRIVKIDNHSKRGSFIQTQSTLTR